LSIIQKNEGDEFLVYFPQFKEQYLETEKRYKFLVAKVEELWNKVKGIANQKEFSLTTKNFPTFVVGALYQLRKNQHQASVLEFYAHMPAKKLLTTIHEAETVYSKKETTE